MLFNLFPHKAVPENISLAPILTKGVSKAEAEADAMRLLMIPGLQARRFDMVAVGRFIKPERCDAVAFLQPDLCDAERFMIRGGSPMGLKSIADIASSGAKVGVVGGGAEEKLAI